MMKAYCKKVRNGEAKPLKLYTEDLIKEAYAAGMEEESTQAYHAGLYDGILRGRREVVDYFFYEVGIVALMGCSTMEECKSKLPGWQDKLKDWGL